MRLISFSTRLIAAVSFLSIVSCSPTELEQQKTPAVVSLLGKEFYEPARSPERQASLDSSLLVAKQKFDADPSEENFIWYGRRTAYLMKLNEAVKIYSDGLNKYPDSYRLYRHRGHRYVTLRRFDDAIKDFLKAEELMKDKPLETEPDGVPNKLNKPLSSTQFNVFYHLALSYYLKGDFAKAEAAWNKCMATCENDDSRIAVTDWLYMTLRRMGKPAEANALLAGITDSLEVIENDSYYTRLKMYQGKVQPENVLVVDSTASDYDLSLATQGYGVGNWYYYNGDTTKAMNVFNKVISGKEFAAFGFIAAEAEVAREGN